MTEQAIEIIRPSPLAVIPDTATLVDAFLGGKSPRTIAAYRQDLGDFARFVGAETMDDAARILLGNGGGTANMTALQYRNHLHERGMAPATINRRLAALRSMGALAQTVGMVPFALSVTGAKGQAYRDTRGPGDDGFLRMLVVADLRADAKGVRDRVILRLLHDLALRRGEVVSLDLAHVEQGARTINVLGKGKTGRLPLRLPDPTRDALAAWIVARGDEPGPLFTNLDPTGKGQRLTGVSIYRIVRDIGQQAGIKTWPHGLRHLAITQALDASGGNIRAVRDFSRHASIQTITLYDDKRNSKQGEIAALVAGFTVPRTVRGRAKK